MTKEESGGYSHSRPARSGVLGDPGSMLRLSATCRSSPPTMARSTLRPTIGKLTFSSPSAICWCPRRLEEEVVPEHVSRSV